MTSRPDVRKVPSGTRLPPVFPTLGKFVLYETRIRFYMIAHCPLTRSYRVMKIERNDPTRLAVTIVASDYTRKQVHDLLDMIKAANTNAGGLCKCVTAVGILGFIRFLQGYYLVLATERRCVGQIGTHRIFSVSGTALIPITSSSLLQGSTSAQVRMDEARYKDLLSTLDLTTNYYFSYTYDLTRTLQTNMLSHAADERRPASMFIWNWFLIEEARKIDGINDPPWLLHVIHGYFEHRKCSLFGGRSLSIYLISRKSRLFAGTRYLKRGISFEGNSANDVETEQICHDRNQGCVRDSGLFTSYVQHRASVPLYWTQEPNAMVARPTIMIQVADPVARGMRRHFQDLLQRYGAPVICLNLIRQSEHVVRECTLGEPFRNGIAFLNELAKDDERIEYIAFDFKRVSKSRDHHIADDLEEVAEGVIERTGMFFSGDTYPLDTTSPGFRQRGICRSNCIDSLDRTNVAQFCIGKRALGHQLHSMGFLLDASLPKDSPLVKLLLDMYERMGDCLALQYGGSMMHRQMRKDRAQTNASVPVLYRLRTPNKPKELLVSILRHYQNSFQDKDKQDALNLFLGKFKPLESAVNIWDLSSDFYLHSNPQRVADVSQTTANWTEAFVAAFDSSIRRAGQPPSLDAPLQHAQSDAYFDEKFDASSYTMLDDLFENNRSQLIVFNPAVEAGRKTDTGSASGGVVFRLWRSFYVRHSDPPGPNSCHVDGNADDTLGLVNPSLAYGAYAFRCPVMPTDTCRNSPATNTFRFTYPTSCETHERFTRYKAACPETVSPLAGQLQHQPHSAVVTEIVLDPRAYGPDEFSVAGFT